MRIILFVLISLSWASMANAEIQHSTIFPTFGVIEGNMLTVRSYKKKHGNVPEKLFAYGGGKEFIATLRKKDSFVAAPSGQHHDCDDGGWVGDFIYEVPPSEKPVKVIIFDKKMRIEDKNEGNIFIDLDSHTEWKHFSLTSSEGGHTVWRVKQNEKCISHIDHYTHCNYDTEPDSDLAFKEAMCGVGIDGSNTGF